MKPENEKIIEKIKKVLELSRNNPSQEEAQSAALKAQRLMAEYHISMKDVGAVEDVDTIVENKVNIGTGNKWKYSLASVIAKNFRCKNFFYGKEVVVFYGHEEDAEIAAMTFEALFKGGNKMATNYYQKCRNEVMDVYGYYDGRGIKNSFLDGYIKGIEEVLDRQCTALMIVVPKEVNEKYEEMKTGRNFRTINTGIAIRTNTDGESAKAAGIRAGRDAIASNRLSMAY